MTSISDLAKKSYDKGSETIALADVKESSTFEINEEGATLAMHQLVQYAKREDEELIIDLIGNPSSPHPEEKWCWSSIARPLWTPLFEVLY